MTFKRVAALVLFVLLCALCGCSGESRAAILCISEAQPAAKALCAVEKDLSCAQAETDRAAVQQMDAGACELALLTRDDYEALRAEDDFFMQKLSDVDLARFLILSTAGRTSEWKTTTRVAILGKPGSYGDRLAQQVLSCAFYGTVHYLEEEEALTALRKGRVEVVMGFFAPRDDKMEKVVKRLKACSLESFPEGLALLELPDEALEKTEVAAGGQTAESYVLRGVLVQNGQFSGEKKEKLINALKEAQLTK